ncbi:xanthine/uracil permease [Williamsoniiplasma luminosum]|uniref:NCS2 family permease n=1 Tax=Williamsoniiplasma luminosum TaxID=214888 RepID=A0A2K8NY04_9MOLU|nr:NCS2 family permease [Williamsoniiplasma luminosum]ATZ17523.1 xanthine/uracil permease [Williamsoniiplasma luminosum]AVP49338.1 MAG: NCS2 family permease [Williamsoniiplasma luminosum]
MNKNKTFKADKSLKQNYLQNNKIAKYFKFSDFNTSFKKEIIGGISTFLSMIYILSVEPNLLGKAQSVADPNQFMNAGGVFVATALTSFVATFIMGVCANVPIALAPSMGLNAMFSFNIANQGGIGYEGALIATTISSIIFCIMSVTKLRVMLIKSLPHSIHLAIGVGIGFFIAYVGIVNMGWVEKSASGLPVANLSNFKLNYPGIILGTVVLFGAIILFYKKFFAPIIVMLIGGFIIAIILANVTDNEAIQHSFGAAKWKAGQWNYDEFKGFFSNLENTYKQFLNPVIWAKPTMYISIFIFIILNFFDATGTLTSVNIEMNRASGLNQQLSHKALVIDAGATVLGSGLGVSHMACYTESCVGIMQGARTGFANIITSFGFLLSLALFPIFRMMPDCLSGAATVFIGTVMIKSIMDIEWSKTEIGLGAFFTILFMIITYSIANGIVVGIIAYSIGAIATKRAKQVHYLVWILDFVFVIYLVAYAFMN